MREYVFEFVCRKVREVYERFGKKVIVIGVDIVVSIGGKIFGKLGNEEEVFRMFKILSGRMYLVIMGYCIIYCGEEYCGVVVMEVKFRELDEEDRKSVV